MSKITGDLKTRYFILALVALVFVGIIMMFSMGIGRGFESSGGTLIIASFSSNESLSDEASKEEILKYAGSLFPGKVEVSEGSFGGDIYRHIIIKSFNNPGLASEEFLQKMNLQYPGILLESSDFSYELSSPFGTRTILGLIIPAAAVSVAVFLIATIFAGVKFSLKALATSMLSAAAVFSVFVITRVQSVSVIITGVLITFILGYLFAVAFALKIRESMRGVKNIKVEDKLGKLRKSLTKNYIFVLSFSLIISVFSIIIGFILGSNSEWLQFSAIAFISTAFAATTSYFLIKY
ncbi:MAG: hypothetical protein GX222_07720 [Ruminococcaceae bacterium]|nr:hypothetical protein [Oscillospiraceae bacterium]